MIEKIDIKDASVIDSLKAKIGMATESQIGLMAQITETVPYIKAFVLADNTTSVISAKYGAVIIRSNSLRDAAMFLLSSGGMSLISQSKSNYTSVKDTAGKVNVYRIDDESFIVQNLTGVNRQINITVI